MADFKLDDLKNAFILVNNRSTILDLNNLKDQRWFINPGATTILPSGIYIEKNDHHTKRYFPSGSTTILTDEGDITTGSVKDLGQPEQHIDGKHRYIFYFPAGTTFRVGRDMYDITPEQKQHGLIVSFTNEPVMISYETPDNKTADPHATYTLSGAQLPDGAIIIGHSGGNLKYQYRFDRNNFIDTSERHGHRILMLAVIFLFIAIIMACWNTANLFL
jgi:hypothetical protein